MGEIFSEKSSCSNSESIKDHYGYIGATKYFRYEEGISVVSNLP